LFHRLHSQHLGRGGIGGINQSNADLFLLAGFEIHLAEGRALLPLAQDKMHCLASKRLTVCPIEPSDLQWAAEHHGSIAIAAKPE
jgi:hypothetical protein